MTLEINALHMHDIHSMCVIDWKRITLLKPGLMFSLNLVFLFFMSVIMQSIQKHFSNTLLKFEFEFPP